MNRRTVAWGLAFAAVGALALTGWLPGASAWALGPRVGLGTFLVVTGGVFLVGSFAAAIRTRTERTDSKGGCPVGATCACGHFNFKPKRMCRQCGAATVFVS